MTAVRDQLFRELGHYAEIERIVLYGELMCTESNYDENLKG